MPFGVKTASGVEWTKVNQRQDGGKWVKIGVFDIAAYRMLQQGELAVLPNHAHFISPSVVQVTIEFLERNQLAR